MQHTGAKRVQDLTPLVVEGDLLGIVQKIKIWPSYWIIYAQTRIRSIEWDAKNLLGFGDANGLPNAGQ